jgi:hypothetical protein
VNTPGRSPAISRALRDPRLRARRDRRGALLFELVRAGDGPGALRQHLRRARRGGLTPRRRCSPGRDRLKGSLVGPKVIVLADARAPIDPARHRRHPPAGDRPPPPARQALSEGAATPSCLSFGTTGAPVPVLTTPTAATRAASVDARAGSPAGRSA